MATIYIDNQPYTVDEHQNLLYACLSLGFDLPYFCWHPAMHSVGACRQCAVKVFRNAQDTKGRIVMACMTPATDGTRLSIDDAEARTFRQGVIELLMVNHPHDCPVCDEGGECHLQDMTLMTGHTYRRYRFRKRTHRNQDLGPLVTHEMNRCIACYRCVRFYRDYAGGRDFGVFGWHNDVYFGRQTDGVLQSEFSGNLVEVCPTGVFTDKTLAKHYTRKWDLQTAPSVCVHCGVGCNTIPGERYGTLRRIRNRYNREVNGSFLCDRGRYGYGFVNHARRVRTPLVRARRGGPAEAVSREEAIAHAARLIGDGSRAIGIGSPRASLEANFALRTLVGPERFCCGTSESDCRLVARALGILREGPARAAARYDARRADAVLVLGEDVTQTAPILALALRQAPFRREIDLAMRLHIHAWEDAAVREAIQQRRGPMFIATPAETRLDDVATHVYRAAPDDVARLGYAVARALAADVPAVEDLPGDMGAWVEKMAEALYLAERPLVVSGGGSASEAVIEAAANVAWALRAAGHAAELHYVFPECNSLGMGLLGGGIGQACQAVREGRADTIVVLENNLWRRAEETAIQELFAGAKHVVVLDHVTHDTTEQAEVLLPAATFAESDGTLVNNEGRAQRFYQVFVPQGDVEESWRWLREIMLAAGRTDVAGWQGLDDVVAAMTAAIDVLAPVRDVAPSAGFRIAGQKIPRQTHRASGRTAATANVSVHEPPPPPDPDSALAFTMEGYSGPPPPALIPRFWAPGWNSAQAVNKFKEEVNGPLRGGDPGRRLIEPAGTRTAFFTRLPPPFVRRPGQWQAVPLYHLFGSEEQSALAQGIAELSPGAYLGLHPDDADELGVAEREEVELIAAGLARRLAVRRIESLPRGVVGLPAGLPGVPWIEPLAWVELRKAPVP